MFKVNNKDTRATPITYFTPCSSVSIVNFENAIANQLHRQQIKASEQRRQAWFDCFALLPLRSTSLGKLRGYIFAWRRFHDFESFLDKLIPAKCIFMMLLLVHKYHKLVIWAN